jgi:TetR/AcrR family transcriptional regulator, fatty acid metabolism regulator protein
VRPVGVIRRIIEHGQASGEFRGDLDPETAAIVFYGGIDELISGWVLGRIDGNADGVADAERHVVDMLTAGLEARHALAARPAGG